MGQNAYCDIPRRPAFSSIFISSAPVEVKLVGRSTGPTNFTSAGASRPIKNPDLTEGRSKEDEVHKSRRCGRTTERSN